MVKLFANSGDPDQMPHSVASDLGLHCLPITHAEVSRLQWVKLKIARKKTNMQFLKGLDVQETNRKSQKFSSL